jgi:hypothetical protein
MINRRKFLEWIGIGSAATAAGGAIIKPIRQDPNVIGPPPEPELPQVEPDWEIIADIDQDSLDLEGPDFLCSGYTTVEPLGLRSHVDIELTIDFVQKTVHERATEAFLEGRPVPMKIEAQGQTIVFDAYITAMLTSLDNRRVEVSLRPTGKMEWADNRRARSNIELTIDGKRLAGAVVKQIDIHQPPPPMMWLEDEDWA